MSIYKMYFTSDHFRKLVDNYVIAHRTTYIGAFNSMEIRDAYKAHLHHLSERCRRYRIG